MAILPVDDKAAWRAADFSSPEDYSVWLDGKDVAELDRAIAAYDSRGLGFTDTGRDDFDLPALGSKLDAVYEELKSGRGFVWLRGLPAMERSIEWMRGASWAIATRLGTPVNQLIGGSMMCDVKQEPLKEGATRYYNTPFELDLHADPTCDIVGIVCHRQAATGGDTYLASAITGHNVMAEENPELLEILYRGYYLHRFGECWPDEGELTAYRVPTFANIDGKVSWRNLHESIFAAARERGETLSAAEIDAMEVFNEIVKRPENRITFTLQPGDAWITNNLTILHGRKTFDGAATDTSAPPRHCLRLWLDGGADFRPIPKEMNFFNRGECGMPYVPGRTNTYRAIDDIRTNITPERATASAWSAHRSNVQ